MPGTRLVIIDSKLNEADILCLQRTTEEMGEEPFNYSYANFCERNTGNNENMLPRDIN